MNFSVKFYSDPAGTIPVDPAVVPPGTVIYIRVNDGDPKIAKVMSHAP